MRLTCVPICACLLLCRCASRAQAAETSTLRLTGLPANAQVYIDGRQAQTAGNALTLAPGHHSIQIEALDSKGEVVAWRFGTDAARGEVPEKIVRLFPIQLASWWPFRREGQNPFEFLPPPPGMRGPEGLEGAAGRAYKGWKDAPADEDILQCLKTAVLLRLDALEAKEQDAAWSLPPPAFQFRAYVYDSGEIRPEPAGPSGSPGPQGIEGLPADVFALEDTQGHKLLDHALRLLDWPLVAQPVKTLEILSTHGVPGWDGQPPRLRLLTPAWRARYEQKRVEGRKASLSAPPFTGTVCPPGAVGPTGPHGARGADGVLPLDAVSVRLDPQRVQRILARLRADPLIQERMRHLEEQAKQTVKKALQAVSDTIE